MATIKTCDKCGETFPLDGANFYRYAASPDGYTRSCKACYKAARGTGSSRTRSTSVVSDGGYIASRELLQIWEAVQATAANANHPLNLMFLGPSGCGKTEGAMYLASLIGVEFTKVDAAAMTDPEAWFGTREVIAKDGVSVTTYRPSEFVKAITKPGVVLIDEINRVRDEHRNILLPILDGSHRVTNPLTGEEVVKDPGCYIIMSGNQGLQFTGTYAVDPALMTRAIIVIFDYLGKADEEALSVARTGCDPAIAAVFVRFAMETRARTATDADMLPVSTREVLAASLLVAKGLSADLAASVAIINGASDEGGAASVRDRLVKIWAGIRPTR